MRSTRDMKYANVRLSHADLVDIIAALEITKNVVSLPKATEK